MSGIGGGLKFLFCFCADPVFAHKPCCARQAAADIADSRQGGMHAGAAISCPASRVNFFYELDQVLFFFFCAYIVAAPAKPDTHCRRPALPGT